MDMTYEQVREFAHEHATRMGCNKLLHSHALNEPAEVFAAVSVHDFGSARLNVKWFHVVIDGVEFSTRQDIEDLRLNNYHN